LQATHNPVNSMCAFWSNRLLVTLERVLSECIEELIFCFSYFLYAVREITSIFIFNFRYCLQIICLT